jgi:predicted GIY-YIG superfamily endonuclease
LKKDVSNRFKEIIESLEEKFNALLESTPVKYDHLPKNMPKRGIYLLTDGKEHLYVGRSNNIRRRLTNHVRATSKQNQATFAFRIARKITGKEKASYTSKNSRVDLENDPLFNKEFAEAKLKIKNMDIQYIEVNDPLHQALLEIYIAYELQTPYNDFENH